MLGFLEVQAKLNDELMKRVSGMQSQREKFKLDVSKDIGEAVKGALESLERQTRARIPEHVYG